MQTFTNVYQFVLLSLLCILQCYRCLPTDFKNATDLTIVRNREWEHPLHQNLFRFPENISHPYFRGKRSINLGPGTLSKQKTYQACIAPSNQPGHCKHFSGCVLEQFRLNFERFMDYMCIIEQTYIGMCCPDSIVTTRADKTFDDDLASVLPAIANLDDDKEEWDENENKNEPSTDDKDAISRNNATLSDIKEATIKRKIRIVGGQPADPKKWPWMVALLQQGAMLYCGGVLINDMHVLTAAHCVDGYQPRDITVRLGEYDFTKSDKTRALDFMVSKIRIHEDFKSTTHENDIAIIKINRPTAFNSYIRPISRPPAEQSFENKNAIVIGWGAQCYEGPTSTVLMEVTVPVWPQERCVRSFTQRNPYSNLCAGAYEGGRDACQGDSGGPLLHQLDNGRWVTIGIVSCGFRCGESGYPGIYTNVSFYLDWISERILDT